MDFIDKYEEKKSWSTCEAYARSLLYLGEEEKAVPYFLEGAEHLNRLIQIVIERRNNLTEAYRCKQIQANYYRLAGFAEQSQSIYEELSVAYLELYREKYRSDPDFGVSILHETGECFYFLGDYEKSIFYGKQVKHWFPIYLGYAEAIRDHNKRRIKETLDCVIEGIKEERTLPYYTGSTVSLWDWYEIGRNLLRLDSELGLQGS
ncbi:hypothetical protein [Saccharopolyspora sp. NPDC002376]